MQPISQEPMIIELDDPAPRWFRLIGALAVVLVMALMLAPWAIPTEAEPESTERPGQQTRTAEHAPICQPTVDFPSFAQPAVSMAMPSWMRLCDWFADPAVAAPGALPTEPAIGPHYLD